MSPSSSINNHYFFLLHYFHTDTDTGTGTGTHTLTRHWHTADTDILEKVLRPSLLHVRSSRQVRLPYLVLARKIVSSQCEKVLHVRRSLRSSRQVRAPWFRRERLFRASVRKFYGQAYYAYARISLLCMLYHASEPERGSWLPNICGNVAPTAWLSLASQALCTKASNRLTQGAVSKRAPWVFVVFVSLGLRARRCCRFCCSLSIVPSLRFHAASAGA